MSKYIKKELENMTVESLVELCRQEKIELHSGLRKRALVALLVNQSKIPEPANEEKTKNSVGSFKEDVESVEGGEAMVGLKKKPGPKKPGKWRLGKKAMIATIVSAVVAIIALVASFIMPEFRQFVGLDEKPIEHFAKDKGPFERSKDGYHILILPFAPLENCTTRETNMEETVKRRLLEKSEKEGLGLKVKFIKGGMHCPTSFEEGRRIGEELKADLVIWGEYIEPSGAKDVESKLRYALVKDQYRIEGTGDTGFHQTSMRELREGKLQNDIDYVIHWTLGLRAYEKREWKKALEQFGLLPETQEENQGSVENLIGSCFYHLAEYGKAKIHYEEGLANRRETLGEDHPDTAGSLNNLGVLLQDMGDLAGARPYFEQALAINRKALGEDHPSTAGSLNNLGSLLQATGDLAGARPYLEQALAIMRKALGEDHPDTAGSLNNLGMQLQAMGDLAGARPYLEQALAITRKALGKDHPNTAASLNNLGSLLYAMGDLAGARPYFEQGLAIRRKALGEDHPDTAASINSLGSLLYAMGDLAGARPYLEQGLAIKRKALGEDHPNTAIVRHNLNELLQKIGELDK